MSVECSQCGATNPAAARYCRRCGRAFLDAPIRSTTRLTPLMQQWRQLSTRLTRKDVRKLLGEPAGVQVPGPDSNLTFETWSYSYERAESEARRVTARVQFAPGGGVVSWKEPEWDELA